MQHFEDRIEEVLAEEIMSIPTRAKQKEHDDVAKAVSNSQLQKETLKGMDKERKKKKNQSIVIET